MKLLKDESGQGFAEYGLIVFIIAISAIGFLTILGKDLDNKFGQVVEGFAVWK